MLGAAPFLAGLALVTAATDLAKDSDSGNCVQPKRPRPPLAREQRVLRDR
jgi:hypothetical protein